jgi:uncharacterized protein (UPF0276 family)
MSVSRPQLGHGIGLRHKHYDDFFAGRPAVDWVEAISENYFGKGGRPLAALLKVRREMPVTLHGVSLSIGSAEPLNWDYLKKLKALVERVEPALVTDHLCWGSHGGRYVHDLWPLPYIEEMAAHVAERVAQVQDFLGRSIALENVSSYAEFQASTMPEWEFLRAVAERADCGILLDLNNVYVSAQNHGFSPEAYVRAIPRERVVQLHLAGYSDHGSHLLDTHDAPVWDPVWALYRSALPHLGAVPTLVEWDDKVPELGRLIEESQKARNVESEVLQARRSVG